MSVPPMPHSWQALWSAQHNRWYYAHISGASQWEPPSIPAPVSPAVVPSASIGSGLKGMTDGLMGRFNSLTSNQQAAVGVVGGLAAGALVEHELHRHRRHLGGMVGLLGAAGIGAALTHALGSRNAQQPQQPQQYAAPTAPGFQQGPQRLLPQFGGASPSLQYTAAPTNLYNQWPQPLPAATYTTPQQYPPTPNANAHLTEPIYSKVAPHNPPPYGTEPKQ